MAFELVTLWEHSLWLALKDGMILMLLTRAKFGNRDRSGREAVKRIPAVETNPDGKNKIPLQEAWIR